MMRVLLLWLVEFLGLQGLKRLSFGIVKWTIRLLLLVGLGVLVWKVLLPLAKEGLSGGNLLWALVALALAFTAFGWLRKRQGGTDAGERTIDGKTVPDMLATAALAIPVRSPDAGYVRRGLPQFGKVLLKLDAREFEYEPEMALSPVLLPPPEPEELPVKPARLEFWFGSWSSFAVTMGVAGFLGFYFYSNRPDTLIRQAKSGDARAIDKQGSQKFVLAPHHAPPVSDPPAEAQQKAEAVAVHTFSGVGVKAVEAEPQPPPPEATKPRYGRPYLPPADDDAVKDEEAGVGGDERGGLFWTVNENGDGPLRDYAAAERYCKLLVLGNRGGWRLPTFSELEAVNLRPHKSPRIYWSSTLQPDGIHHAARQFGTIPAGADVHDFTYALCVH